MGIEYRVDETLPAREKKKLVVVGGGVAGMEAARVASLRGHEVTLLEKSDRLGGQVNLACVPPNKDVLKRIIKYYDTALKTNGVNVKLGTEATASMIQKMDPDQVVVATGAVQLEGVIPATAPTVNAWDILSGAVEKPEGKTVAIIGGGSVACETAEFIAQNSNNKVVVFEMLPFVGNGYSIINMVVMNTAFATMGIETKVSTRVEKIDEDGIHYVNEQEGQQVMKADTIVMAIGSKSVRGLVEELDELDIPARYIGDAKIPANILDSVRLGFYAGYDV